MANPCYGCQKRHENCHSECEDYQDFAREREEIRRQKILHFEIDSIVTSNMMKGAIKKKLWKKRGRKG